MHLKSDSLTSLLIVIFDLPADHGTSSSHPLLSLPQKPQETGSYTSMLVTQWSVQPWRGPLLQSHGRLAQGLMRPCELYFLTSYSCPEAHDSFTQDMENVSKFMAVTDRDVALFLFFFLFHTYVKIIILKTNTGDIWVTGGLLEHNRNDKLELRCLYTYKALRYKSEL